MIRSLSSIRGCAKRLALLVALVSVAGCGRVPGMMAYVPPAELSSGVAALRRGNRDAAQRSFDAALKARPGDADTYRIILEACGRAGDRGMVDHFVASTMPAYSRADTAVRVKTLLGASIAYDLLGDPKESVKYAEEAFKLQPNDPDVLNALGYGYAEADVQPARAVELTQAAVRMARERSLPDENVGIIADSLGWAYLKAGRVEEAVQTLVMAVELTPAQAEIYYHLAAAYHAAHRDQDAAIMLNRAMQLNPDAPSTRARLQQLERELNPPSHSP